jgi:riboflavin synthase
MFTGLVAAVGRIVRVQPLGGQEEESGLRLYIDAANLDLRDVKIGDSIAVQGACMTVLALSAHGFEVEISRASLALTVGLEREGAVNLEKSLCLGEPINGHLVAGHVDGLGKLRHFRAAGESRELVIRAPARLAPYLAVKGSVTVNGVSLTVNRVHDNAEGCDMSLNIIAHTLAVTTLAQLQVGDQVNLEIDLIARYVERMLSVSGR